MKYKHEALLRRLIEPLYAQECEDASHKARVRERVETELIQPALAEFEALVDGLLAEGMTLEQIEEKGLELIGLEAED